MTRRERGILSEPPSRPFRRGAARVALAAGLLALACHTVPVTGRRSLNTYSTADDIQLGREAYQQVLADARLVRTGPKHDMVARVMTRLTSVADDPGFEWQVSLIQDDDTVNAFALPGGKLAVYTGILRVCQSETGLAVVMGHEIGHVVAQHGTERMTSTLGLDMVLELVQLGDYTRLASKALDVFLNLPFGRSQEAEADQIGLMYMARAGYDPREAVGFWERMQAQAADRSPEFLSTHPSHESRIESLKAGMPRAMDEWRRVGGGLSR